jgi:protease-4
MKQFFKYVLATMTGLLFAFILSVLILIIIGVSIIGAASSKDKTFKVKTNSVLHLNFSSAVMERTPNNPFKDFNFSSFSGNKQIGLNDILENIKKAETDPDVKGIYMDMSSVPAGIATIEEMRNALLEFKKSGKFILSYSEGYNQGAYYLSSVADKIYLNPQGNLDWKGLSAQIMFFKGAMEKLDISAQIFRHGKFKSAIEPFDLDRMSAANRLQTMSYVGAIWNHILEGISKARAIPVEDLNRMADQLEVRMPEDALRLKMVDGLKYKDELIAELKGKLGLQEKDKINTVEMEEYARTPRRDKKHGKEKIAIIYAVGSIQGGEGDEETIGSERISKALREARLDSTIKAIVFRVNSPGGSALASDVIWREALLAEKAKPFIVSMGDVAASGGYYISCAADVIVAQPNTITGSIGVFGILPNAQKFLNNKLGITIDTANTNKHADMGSVFRPVSPEEGKVVQQGVEHIYDVFIGKVAAGRKKTTAEVDSIGQGRVWSGVDAKRLGLVDELGGINDAINIAAQKAKLESYKIVELPKQKDFLESLFKEVTEDTETRVLKKELGINYEYYRHFREMTGLDGVQARMSYDVVLF